MSDPFQQWHPAEWAQRRAYVEYMSTCANVINILIPIPADAVPEVRRELLQIRGCVLTAFRPAGLLVASEAYAAHPRAITGYN